jgi:hypothetical protein
MYNTIKLKTCLYSSLSLILKYSFIKEWLVRNLTEDTNKNYKCGNSAILATTLKVPILCKGTGTVQMTTATNKFPTEVRTRAATGLLNI